MQLDVWNKLYFWIKPTYILLIKPKVRSQLTERPASLFQPSASANIGLELALEQEEGSRAVVDLVS